MWTKILTILGIVGILLFPGNIDAKKNNHHRRPEPIVIVNNADPRWDAAIQETVEEFRHAMPKNGPKIKLIRGDVVACSSTICSGQLDPGFWGFATLQDPRNGYIWLQDGSTTPPTTPEQLEYVVCHEMMHLITGIPDNYGALPNESCVWGNLIDLGPFDIKKIEKKYGKK